VIRPSGNFSFSAALLLDFCRGKIGNIIRNKKRRGILRVASSLF